MSILLFSISFFFSAFKSLMGLDLRIAARKALHMTLVLEEKLCSLTYFCMFDVRVVPEARAECSD